MNDKKLSSIVEKNIVNNINYTRKCARATLYPGLAIDEIPLLKKEDLNEEAKAQSNSGQDK